MIKLEITENATQKVMEFDSFPVTIGRDDDNSVKIADNESSRNHCRIDDSEHGYKLVDLESRNGTMLNGAFANQGVLKDGDRIEIGKSVITFKVHQALKPAARAGQKKDRGDEAAAHAPEPKESNPAVMFFSIVVVLVGIGLIVYFMVNSGPSRGKPDNEDSYANALEAIEAERYESAIDLLRLVPFSSNRYTAARSKISEVEALIKMRDLKVCTDEWNKLLKFVERNGSIDPKKLSAKYREYLISYPKSPFATQAEQEMTRLDRMPEKKKPEKSGEEEPEDK